MKKLRVIALILTCAMLLSTLFESVSYAGIQVLKSDPRGAQQSLNTTEWNFLDENILMSQDVEGSLVVPAETSTSETRFISKNIAKRYQEVDDMIAVESNICLRQLPEGQKFIFAFGLSGIESYSGEAGNVEIAFANNGGIKMEVVVYNGTEAVTILKPTSCGIALNKEFDFYAEITANGVLTVKVNNSRLLKKQLPVSGEGRFGVLQTGSCGAVFTKLDVITTSYERPENTELYEDFEKGEFNANLLFSNLYKASGVYPCQVGIEEYNGSKVLMFRNSMQANLGTLHKYSNFELTFDIPYWLSETLYDEKGNLIAKPNYAVAIGFGEIMAQEDKGVYSADTDMVLLFKTKVQSHLKKKYDVTYDVAGLPGEDSNEGFSVKFTCNDGHTELAIKPLKAENYTTVATADYEEFRSGYVKIWAPNIGNFAIDNLKIVNKDKNPNLIEVEYKSSVITAEDYVPTEEDMAMVFREDVDEEKTEGTEQERTKDESQKANTAKLFAVGCVIGAAVLLTTGIIVGSILKRRKLKGGQVNEEE